MKSSTTGALSGCIVWLLVFSALGACLLPLALAIGGFTSASQFAVGTVAPFICPRDTTGTVYSYETTTTDDHGFRVPATAYELHCVDADGTTVKNDPILYALLWEGIAAGAAVLIMAILAFVLAAPAGVIAGRFLARHAHHRV